MTRPTAVFFTLLTLSKSSPSATGVSSVAAATGGRRAEGHSEEKVKEKEECVWKEMQILQVLNHLGTVRPISLPLLCSLACFLPVVMIRVRVCVIVGGLMCSFVPVVRVAVKVPSEFRVRHRRRAL